MQSILEGLFWLFAAVPFYVYLGYPFILFFLSGRRKASSIVDLRLPSVSLIISAYNENKLIQSKLENALTLDYPKDLLEILVISDCSDDGTDEIVRRFPDAHIQLVRQAKRLGKSAGLNLGVPKTFGQILVFSDANALYHPVAVRRLVRHFSDPKVGYVVGNSRYLEDPGSQAVEAEGCYWKVETWLKKCESRFHSVVGADGAIYAIRRELYTPLRPTDINDFLNPLQIVDMGFVGVFEPTAISFERAAGSFEREFRRKTRIVSRSLGALVRVPGVLNPFKNFRHWFMLMSHKILRWFAPFYMIVLLAVSIMLWEVPTYELIAILQLSFYSFALAGWLSRGKLATLKVFYFPYYFCLVNLASLVGIFRYLRGDLPATWKPARHEADDGPWLQSTDSVASRELHRQ
jgi:cellulose synthase/poly-beta-1,6-N-acetylglucosamine synthase-like glycosyltransferase